MRYPAVLTTRCNIVAVRKLLESSATPLQPSILEYFLLETNCLWWILIKNGPSNHKACFFSSGSVMFSANSESQPWYCPVLQWQVQDLVYTSPISPPFFSQPAVQSFFISVVLPWTRHVLLPPGSLKVNTTFLANTVRFRSFIAVQIWGAKELAIVKWICTFEWRNLNS